MRPVVDPGMGVASLECASDMRREGCFAAQVEPVDLRHHLLGRAVMLGKIVDKHRFAWAVLRHDRLQRGALGALIGEHLRIDAMRKNAEHRLACVGLGRQVRHGEVPAAGAEKKKEEPNPPQRRRATLDDLRAVRKVRDRHFPTELFSDPCWEMLLDLYDAQLDEAEVTVSSLGAASGVPLTTALRRMDVLQKHGFIERLVDPDDRRRTIVRLSATGLAAVEKFFDSYALRLKR